MSSCFGQLLLTPFYPHRDKLDPDKSQKEFRKQQKCRKSHPCGMLACSVCSYAKDSYIRANLAEMRRRETTDPLVQFDMKRIGSDLDPLFTEQSHVLEFKKFIPTVIAESGINVRDWCGVVTFFPHWVHRNDDSYPNPEKWSIGATIFTYISPSESNDKLKTALSIWSKVKGLECETTAYKLKPEDLRRQDAEEFYFQHDLISELYFPLDGLCPITHGECHIF